MPSRAGSAGTGTYIVFSQPAGVPGQSKAGWWLTGGRLGRYRRLGHVPTTTASEAELLLGALSLQPGWFWLRLEDEAHSAPGVEGGRQGMELGT